jgi:hypothetical protein
MEQRGIAEAGAAAGISGAVAAGTLVVVAGTIDWAVVVGLAAGGALAAAANYRARTGHAESVAAEAPEVTADNYEAYTQPAAGDGGTEGMETDDPASTDTPDGPDERDYSSH